MVLLISSNISCLYAIYIKSKNMSVIGWNVPLTSQPSSLSQVPTVPNGTEIRINILDHNYDEIDELDIVKAKQNIDKTSDKSDADSKSVSQLHQEKMMKGIYTHTILCCTLKWKANYFYLDEHHNATNLRSNDPVLNSLLSSRKTEQNTNH